MEPNILPSSTIPEIVSFLKSSLTHDNAFSPFQKILVDRENSLKSELGNVKKEGDSLKKKLENQLRQCEQLKERVSQLEKDKIKLETLKREDDLMKKIQGEQLKDYLAQCDQLKEKVALLEKEKRDLENVKKGQEGDLSYKTRQCVQLKEKVSLLEKEKKVLSDRIRQVDSEKNKEKEMLLMINELKNEKNKLLIEKNKLEKKLMAYEQKSKELYDRVSRLEAFDQAESIQTPEENEPLPPISPAAAVGVHPLARQSSSPIVLISDSDEELASNKTSNSCGLGGINRTPSSNMRKRIKSGGEGNDGSTSRRRETTKFMRRCEGGGVDNPIGANDSDSEDSCSTRNMNMLVTNGRRWSSEADLRSALEKDPLLCLNAICALYRLQNSSLKNLSSSINQTDKASSITLGVFLTDLDTDKKLKLTVSEVPEDTLERCKNLAIRYCRQLFQLYLSNEDSLFCPGVVF